MFSRLSRFCVAATLATLLFTPFASASKPTGWPQGEQYQKKGKKKNNTNGAVPAAPTTEAIAAPPTPSSPNDTALPVKRTNEDPTIREKNANSK